MDEQNKVADTSLGSDTSLSSVPTELPPVPPQKKSPKKYFIVGAFVAIVLLSFAVWYFLIRSVAPVVPTASIDQSTATRPAPTVASDTPAAATKGLVLNESKDYGNKYADGLLPVGDNKYVTNAAKKGYVYLCNASFVPASQAGAQTRGPWFSSDNATWDYKKKSSVSGAKTWQSQLTNTLDSAKRTITTNDLPTHPTGVFPVANTDPVRKYDANPNSISAQNLTYSLAASPAYGDPQCMGGEVGVMLTGVALFNAFDAGGRDAGAWEVQDACDGHPQNKGEYHYHTLSRCINDISVSTIIGYALDGFPITGPNVGAKGILTTDDLDECHGLTSTINSDGKSIVSYHYVMTQDFPYSVSCFRSAAAQPPGEHEAAGKRP